MAKSNKTLINEEVKNLQKLLAWADYYRDNKNPYECAKVQKEIEEQKKRIKFLREAAGLPQ